MADVPLYVSTLAPPDTRMPLLQPTPLPPSGGLEEIGRAVAGFASEAGKFVATIKHGQEQTERATATGEYLTRLSELETAAMRDPDYKNAPGKFQAQQRELELEVGTKISNPYLRQLTMLEWRRAGLSAGKHVTGAAFGREKDANQASIAVHSEESLKNAYEASSPIERDAIVGGHIGFIQGQANAGWINQETAVKLGQQFQSSLSRAEAARVIRTNPTAAPALLADPNNFKGLDPVTRESFKNAAANAHDQVKIDSYSLQAATDPAGARAVLEQEKDTLQPHSQFRALQAIEAAERQATIQLDQAARTAAQATRTGDNVLDLIKQGIEVDPVRVENVRNAQIAAAARGDQAAATYLRELDLHTQLQPHVRKAWSLPYNMLDATVRQMESDIFKPREAGAPGPTTDQVTAYKAFKAVRDEINQKRNTEPIILGGPYGGRYYDLAPIDPAAAATDINLRRELWRRGGHANENGDRYGGGSSVLTAEEGKQFKDRYDAAGPGERFALLETLGETLNGRALRDTTAAIAGGDPLTVYVAQLSQTNRNLAREILQGQAWLTSANVQEQAGIVRAELQGRLGAVLPTPDMHKLATEAVLAVDASRRHGIAAGNYDPKDISGLDKAITDVVGEVSKRNGGKFPITPGAPSAAFLTALDSITDAQLEALGGAIDGTGRRVSAAQIRDGGILRPIDLGGSRYVVGVKDPNNATDGFAPLINPYSGPLVIDMRPIMATHAAAQAEETKALREQRAAAPSGFPFFGGGPRAATEKAATARRDIEQPPTKPAEPPGGPLIVTPENPAGEGGEE